jgi:hypothetical protein
MGRKRRGISKTRLRGELCAKEAAEIGDISAITGETS